MFTVQREAAFGGRLDRCLQSTEGTVSSSLHERNGAFLRTLTLAYHPDSEVGSWKY